MRVVCWMFAVLAAACGAEVAPDAVAMPQNGGAARTDKAPAITPATGQLVESGDKTGTAKADDDQPAAPSSGPSADEQRAAKASLAALLANAVAGGAMEQGRAPAQIRALGVAALPALAETLSGENVTERRIAALTLLQWGDELHRTGAAAPVLEALAAARNDLDPSVRTAATHAYRRATGDTTIADQNRAADEAARRAAGN